MKFFNNLPKTTFTTTIGDFVISDFFTYLDVTKKQLDTNSISVDDKTTLIEASYQTYTDTNNFWTFLSANKTINPFDLLSLNSFLFSKNNADKINLTLLPSPGAVTGGSAFPIGSIIVPATGNTGASYTFGYTGNFNINGQFALIESTSYYDGNMIIGTQYGGTGPFITVAGTAENVTVLQKNQDGSFTWAGSYYTGNKKLYSDEIKSQRTVAEAEQKDIDKRLNKVRIDLPKVESNTQNIINTIDNVLTHPGFKDVIGMPSISGILNLPTSDARNFRSTYNQLSGQQFIAAYDALRGTGSISENEGRRAEESIAALRDPRISEKEFTRNAEILRNIVKNNVDKMRLQVGRDPKYTPLSTKDQKAYDWARANPRDPMSRKIMDTIEGKY
jgi:hypothetical protein